MITESIMAGVELCKVCNRKVLTHSYNIRCFLCKELVHLKCLPNVRNDDPLFRSYDNNCWFCSTCTSDILPFNHLPDDEFIPSLAESWEHYKSIPHDLLTNSHRLFSPFELNDGPDSPLSDIDPDIQYYNNQCNSILNSCDYYVEDSLNKKMAKLGLKGDVFSLLHTNIRSASRNLSKFESYLSNIDHEFSIIALSESWIKDHNKDLYHLEHYRSEHVYRPDRGGGGVSLFMRKNIEYFMREDLSINNRTIESMFIEVKKESIGKTQDAIVAVIYRPPDTDIRAFNDYLNSILSKLKAEKKLLYLLGDFNINLLNADTHQATQEFIDLMYSHTAIPNITKPTRVTKKYATLIDNIFCNSLYETQKILTGILYTDLTDHFPVFHIDYTSIIKHDESTIKRRIYNQSNVESFSSALRNHSWDHVLSSNDAQTAYTAFLNDYTGIYNSCFPMKTVKIGYKNRKAWLSEGLKRAIKIKNQLYRKQRKSNNDEHELIYKRFRNKLNGMLIKAERNHYSKLIEENKNNMKKSWSILKEVINKRKSDSSCSRFIINDQIVSDKHQISNGFNSFFVNIGPSLAKKIPSDSRSPTIFMRDRVVNSMVLENVLSNEVVAIVKNLKEGGSGWDCISASIVKTTYRDFIEPLTHIFDLSISQGVFPNELKVARVVPLFKSGNSMVLSNYRPVSVLPVFSKILERLIYNRLLSFVKKYNILYQYQFGFRAEHSPNLALIFLVDKISNALEKGDYVLGLFS